MTKTIAIYSRISRSEEAAGQSIDAQVRECISAAKQTYGEDIDIQVYKDEQVNGQTWHKPALRLLKEDIDSKPFTGVIVSNLSRIDRSTVRTAETIRWFMQKQVDFVSNRDDRCFKWDDFGADFELRFLELEAVRQSNR